MPGNRRLMTANCPRERVKSKTSANVMRFENLGSDFRQFVSSLGVAPSPRLPHVRKGILANNLDPRDFLDRPQINLINEIFREEFEAFHYEPL